MHYNISLEGWEAVAVITPILIFAWIGFVDVVFGILKWFRN